MACLYSHCLGCRLPCCLPLSLPKNTLYPPLTHGHQRKHSRPSRRRHKRLWWFTTLLCTANSGFNFFSCGTARKTQVKLEFSKKANTDFHSPERFTVQRVMWVLLEKNILPLTDGTAETVLRMKSMKSYWTLIFNCISTTSIQQWLPSYSGVFSSFWAIWQDNAGIQLVLVAVLVPAMTPTEILSAASLFWCLEVCLCHFKVFYIQLRSLTFKQEGKCITYLSPESIKKPEAVVNSKEHIF